MDAACYDSCARPCCLLYYKLQVIRDAVYINLMPRHTQATAVTGVQPMRLTNAQHTPPCSVPHRPPHVMSLLGGSAAAPGVHAGGREGPEGVPGSSALHYIRQASQGSLSQRFLRTLRLTVQVNFFNPLHMRSNY